MVSLERMDHIGVVGLSYRHASVEDVARFAIPRCDVEARLPDLRTALHGAEVVFLATCNRVEVIFATGDASAAGDLRGAIRNWARPPRRCAPGRARRRSNMYFFWLAVLIPRRLASMRSPPSCAARGTWHAPLKYADRRSIDS